MISEYPTISQNIQFIINGFIIVMLVLGLLTVLCTIIGHFFVRFENQKPQTTKPQLPNQPIDLSPEIVAVVAAAVNVIIKQPCRVLEIKPTDQPGNK